MKLAISLGGSLLVPELPPRIPTRVVNGQQLQNILGVAEGKDIGTLLN